MSEGDGISDAAGPFGLEAVERSGRRLLVLRGEIDLDAAVRLHAVALRLLVGNQDVDIDWSGAERLSAGAVQVLLALGAALSERGRALRVAADQSAIRQCLDAAGLAGHFPAEVPAS